MREYWARFVVAQPFLAVQTCCLPCQRAQTQEFLCYYRPIGE